MHMTGEFGIVYKGYFAGQHTNEVVAIKTLKGIKYTYYIQSCCIIGILCGEFHCCVSVCMPETSVYSLKSTHCKLDTSLKCI